MITKTLNASPANSKTGREPGLAPRRIAAEILDQALSHRRPIDEQFDGVAAHPELAMLDERDRALTRMIVATTLRRLGSIRTVLDSLLTTASPKSSVAQSALLTGAAQILFMDIPDHAAVDLSVDLVRGRSDSAGFSGLINAVLRRCAREGKNLLPSDPSIDTPAWLFKRWSSHYGEAVARAIAAAHHVEPALDLSVKSDPSGWAARLGGSVMPNGSVRLVSHGPITKLDGYDLGAWWVQDAAASLPVRLFGDVAGKRVVDLCAAPGGKTAQLALGGANVTAVDRSGQRLKRLNSNLARLGLDALVVEADVQNWQSESFDAVLLDAPCSSTGTIRRHPDIPWIKNQNDIGRLADLQARLLDRAAALTKPGGLLVFCTCSLEPEEGEHQIGAFLARYPEFRRRNIRAEEVAGADDWITRKGDLRTLPCHWPNLDPRLAGLDGFFAARLVRLA